MIKIDYPTYQPKIKKEQQREFIFDSIRKRWVVLTPEEWVRQNFLQYLIHKKKYAAALIAVEKEIQLGDIHKRFDIVVYTSKAQPFMLIECKEMNVNLTPDVLNQVLRYNIALRVPYIVITNGIHCRAFSTNNSELTELTELP